MNSRPLTVQFRTQYKILVHPPTLLNGLHQLYQLREHLRQFDSRLADWFLGGNSEEEALLHPAFDEKGPTSALVAVLREKSKQDPSPILSRAVGLWNGRDQGEGATMGLVYRQVKEPSFAEFKTRITEFLTYKNVLATVQSMVHIWNPLFVSVESVFYDSTFRDRPGVGWMLYLPEILTPQEVPEARALVPVMANKKQIGTIIASVSNEAYSDEQTEHAKTAHAIEIRLVDQDLLPKYSDM